MKENLSKFLIFNMAKDKPDMFAENKAIMPYGDNIGAPSIKPTNIAAYKQEK